MTEKITYSVRFKEFGSEILYSGQGLFDYSSIDTAIEEYNQKLEDPKVCYAEVVKVQLIESVVKSGTKKQFIEEVNHGN